MVIFPILVKLVTIYNVGILILYYEDSSTANCSLRLASWGHLKDLKKKP